MSTFYICWCGNREGNHNFKHAFSPCVEVKNGGEFFTFSSLGFPIKEGEKCRVKDCTAAKGLHKKKETPRISEIINPVTIIEHDFDPEKYTYREVKFSVPPEAVCVYKNSKGETCGIKLDSHYGINHNFTTKIDIQDLEKQDKVEIFSREFEDKKILYK